MQNLEAAMRLQMQQEAQEQQHEEKMHEMTMNRDIEVERAGKANALEQADFFRQQQQKAEADAKEREAQARADRNSDMDRMERMMGMFGDKMMGMSQNLMGAQQQRADEYRQQAQQAQQRQDHAQDQALAAVGGVATAAASNIYTQHTNTNVNVQQPQQTPAQQAAPETFEYQCYNCGHTVRIYQGQPQCPDCGAPYQW
jgi:rubrerythrin